MSLNINQHVTIRFSGPHDAAKIERLAQLDGARPPRLRLLVAEIAGEPRAALPIDGGAAVADPFRHTLDRTLAGQCLALRSVRRADGLAQESARARAVLARPADVDGPPVDRSVDDRQPALRREPDAGPRERTPCTLPH
jgi:hypothetical protein